jgi:hypothetical protein
MRNLENLAGRLPGTGRTNTLTKQALSLRNMLDEQLAKFKPSAFSSGVYEDGDEAMLLADSLLKAYKEKTAVNRTLWQGLEDTLATTPTTKVRPANLRSALLPLFNKYGKQINAMPNEEAVRMLKFIAEEPGSVRNGLTFQQMREIQKGLGELSGQAERQAATGNTSRELAASIGEAYSAIMNDLDSWGRNLRNGKAHAAYKAASEDYKTSVLPYRKTPMVNKLVAMTDTDPLGDGSVLQYGVDPQQLMALLTRPSQGQLLQRIVGLSGNDGKEALQYGLLKTKLHPTFNEASGSLRPAAFGNKARQLEPQMRIYTPEQSKLVEDTTRILQAGDRANANVYHPADTVGSVLLGAAGVAHPLGAAAVLGSGDALQRGAFSKWGKNLLLASPQLVPTAVGGKLSRGLPAGAASGQGLRMYNSLIAPTDDNEWEDR